MSPARVRGFVPIGACCRWGLVGVPKGIKVIGQIVLIADDTYGLQVVDCSNLHHPFVIDGVITDGLATGVDLRGDFAYVSVSNPHSAGGGLIQVVDLTTSRMEIVREIPVSDTPIDIKVAGEVIYLLTYAQKTLSLKAYNLSSGDPIGSTLEVKKNIECIRLFP